MRFQQVIRALLALAVAACGTPVTEYAGDSALSLNIVTAGASVSAIDQARIHIEGPTPSVVTAAPGTTSTITGLQPGTYTVAVEGLVGGEVDRYGETSVVVTAGRNTTASVNLGGFAPTVVVPAIAPLDNPVMIGITPVPNATDYDIAVQDRAGQNRTTRVTITGSSSVLVPVAPGLQEAFEINVTAITRFGTPGRRPGGYGRVRDVTYGSRIAESFGDILPGNEFGVENGGLAALQGIFADEYVDASTSAFLGMLDRRSVDLAALEGPYVFMHYTRQELRALASYYEARGGATAAGGLRVYEGFIDLWLAETFCSGIGAGDLVNGILAIGVQRTTQQVFEDAVAAFDKALAVTPYPDARVGKARALLALDRLPEALAQASQVPVNFVSPGFPVTNYVHTFSADGRISLAEREGGTGLPFRSQLDPRVPWQDAGVPGQDGQTRMYRQQVFPQSNSVINFASGIEARLIAAEVYLRQNNRAQFEAEHNSLRVPVGFPPIAQLPASMDSLVDFHFRERAFWLHSTAHRLGDLRRLIRQYGRSPNSVFPSGTYHKGGTYGSDVNLPIPPGRGQCIDRNP
jgi:hypothetical protein